MYGIVLSSGVVCDAARAARYRAQGFWRFKKIAVAVSIGGADLGPARPWLDAGRILYFSPVELRPVT